MDYFSKIFFSSNPVMIEDFLKVMDRRVFNDMSEVLDKPFSEKKIKIALDQMHPHKSPRLDRMAACFY